MTAQSAIDLLHLGRCRATEIAGIPEAHWDAWLASRRRLKAEYRVLFAPPASAKPTEAVLRHLVVWTPRVRSEALEMTARGD